MTISFSHKAITEVIMARVAMRRHLNPDKPSMLTRDHASALEPFVAQAFSEICLAMIPHVVDCGTDGDIMTIELQEPAQRPAEVRIALEAAMAARVLQLLFEGTDSDYAVRLAVEYEALTDRARRTCGDSSPVTLKPCWY